MAACTHAVATADTGNTPNASGAFTPAVGDLLIVFVLASATVENPGALTSSVGGFTFTQAARVAYGGSTHTGYCFVSDALVSSAISQTVTFDPVDPANGTVIFVCRVSGISKTGATAIRQSITRPNVGAGTDTTPDVTFGASCLTGNPTLVFICMDNGATSANITEPTGWAEAADTGYLTPNMGAEYATRDSGFTGTNVAWGSTIALAWGAIGVEIDASATATRKGGLSLMGMGR
jgi:hypothetical protein